MKYAARSRLPEALGDAIDTWTGERVLRLRRLNVDITLNAAFEPKVFAALLSRTIVAGLKEAETKATAGDDASNIVCFPSQPLYVVALVEALADGRAMQCWWLRDADGLRFLPPGAAIRTALLADATVGLEALLTLASPRRARVLRALGGIEASRVLEGLAAAGRGEASAAECAAAIAAAAGEPLVISSPLELFLQAAAGRPGMAGSLLAAAARLWADARDMTGGPSASPTARPGTQSARPMDIDVALADAVARELGNAALKAGPANTSFGGLLLVLRDLGMPDIARAVCAWPEGRHETACLVGYAVLGLCAGCARYPQWLADPLWRELFGLDVNAPVAAIVAELRSIAPDAWAMLRPLATSITRQRDVRFLLAPRALTGSRPATHTLAGLAAAALSRFARRLVGFRDASAPFLWANLLSTSAALERRPDGWTARLSRPPLDVLLSLSRLADGSVTTPSGARVELARVTP